MTALTILVPPLLEAISPTRHLQASKSIPEEVTFTRTKPQAKLPVSQPRIQPESSAPHPTADAPQLNIDNLPPARDAEPFLAQTSALLLPAMPLASSLVPDLTLPDVQANTQTGDSSNAESLLGESHSPQRRDTLATGTPRPIRQTRPLYPYAAKIRGIEGRVLVEFTVFPDGHCGEAKVLSSFPAGYFEKAALDAVEKWYFTPAIKDGIAVPVQMKIQIAFDLQNP